MKSHGQDDRPWLVRAMRNDRSGTCRRKRLRRLRPTKSRKELTQQAHPAKDTQGPPQRPCEMDPYEMLSCFALLEFVL